ncbi:hypothetical protein KJS94_01570 [Flavihumibacter rivuli]|uniref:hypothetical protein n=1 Tax=Flavihumibacter rivuli TaxID=2838156 RepID=UPI001BDE4BB3|nr:hypothetical protein [Flavihumibacter rivuli]ULQ56885.1 hypothetical protein KJS94_01570 [Flavihumibacter rivuli]
MANPNQGRRDIGIGICIVLGLIIGAFIKRVHIGLLIGLGLGLLASGLIAGRKR